MTNKLTTLVSILVLGLLFVGCASASNDVPSLKAIEEPPVETNTDTANPGLDDETKMMAFTECMREEGIDLLDPMVDSKGNVQKPQFVPGYEVDEKAVNVASEACIHHLEGFTFEKEQMDVSEQLDQLLALTACLRDKGHDLDDPTAERLYQFKEQLNWDDPAVMADYEACSGNDATEESGK